VNYFENETTVIFKFLKEERKANKELLEVFNIKRYEKECIQNYNNLIGYENPGEIDPIVSFFFYSTIFLSF